MPEGIEFYRFNPFDSTPPRSPQRDEETQYKKNDEDLRQHAQFKKIAGNFGYAPEEVGYVVERDAGRYWIRLFKDPSDPSTRNRFTVAKGSDLEAILKKFYESEDPPIGPKDHTPPPSSPPRLDVTPPHEDPSETPKRTPASPGWPDHESPSPPPSRTRFTGGTAASVGWPERNRGTSHRTAHRPPLSPFYSDDTRFHPRPYAAKAASLAPFNPTAHSRPRPYPSTVPVSMSPSSTPSRTPAYTARAASPAPITPIHTIPAASTQHVPSASATVMFPTFSSVNDSEGPSLPLQTYAAQAAPLSSISPIHTRSDVPSQRPGTPHPLPQNTGVLDAMISSAQSNPSLQFSDTVAVVGAQTNSMAGSPIHAGSVTFVQGEVERLRKETERLQATLDQAHVRLHSGDHASKKEIRGLQDQLTRANQARAQAEQERESLIQRCETLQQSKKNLEDFIETNAEALKQYDSQVATLERELKQYEERASHLQNQIAAMTVALEDATKRAERAPELERQLGNLTADRDGLDRELKELRRRSSQDETTQRAMQSQLDTNREEIESLRRELGEVQTLAGRVPNLEVELKEVLTAKASTEKQAEALTKDLGGLQDEQTRLQEHLGSASRKASELERQVATLTAALEDATKRAERTSELEKQLGNLTADRDRLDRELKELRSRSSQDETTQRELQSQLDTNREEMERLRKELEEAQTLAGRVPDLEAELKEVLTAKASTEKQAEALTKDLGALQDEQTRLQEHLGSASRKASELEGQVGTLTVALEDATKQAERAPELERQLGNLTAERDGLDKELKELRRRSSQDETTQRELQSQLDTNREEMERLRKELEEAQTLAGRVPNLEVELKEVLTAKASAEKQAEVLTKDLGALQDEQTHVKEQLGSASRKASELEGQVAAIAADLQAASTRASELEQQLRELSIERDALKGELAELRGQGDEARQRLQADLDANRQELGQISRELEKALAAKTAAENQAESFGSDLASSQRELSLALESRDRIPALLRELDALSAEREELRLEVLFLEAQLDEKGELQAHLEEALAKLDEVDQTGRGLAEELRQAEEIAARVPELEGFVKAALAAKTAAERRAIAQEAAFTAVQTTNTHLQKELEKREGAWQAKESDLLSRLSSLDKLIDEQNRVLEKQAELQTRSEQTIFDLNAELQARPDEARDLLRQIEEAKDEAARAKEIFDTEIQELEDAHEKEVKPLRNQLAEIKLANAELHDALDQKLREYQKALQLMQEQHQKEIAGMVRELEQLRAKAAPQNVALIAESSEEMKQLAERLGEVIDEREAEAEKVRAAEAQIESMRESFSNSLKEKESLIDTLQNALQNKGSDLLRAQENLSARVQEIRQLKIALTEALADVCDGQDRESKLAKQLQSMTAANEALESKRFELDRALGQKAEELAALQDNLTRWMDGIKAYQAQKEEETAALEDKNAALQKERDELISEKENLIKSNQGYVGSLEILHSEKEKIAELSGLLSEAEGKLAQTEELYREALKAKAAVEERLCEMQESSEEERTRSERKVSTLKRKITRLEGQIAGNTSSEGDSPSELGNGSGLRLS